ncbi:Rft-1-domain-containing protein [Dentipellis sp. KUC8613]|nr:Rft-1-domain-containing protein [Dentipellis sp. KUC8613]
MAVSAPDVLSASLTSASSLVLLQFFSRIFTFVLNQALVRLASPQTFGTAAIQFELLLSTILFLSREGVRNALLRSSDAPASADLVYNISLLPAFGGMLFAALVALIYVRTSSASTRAQPFFLLSVVIYAVAASTELLAEPLYIRAQNELHFDLRVRAEGTAVFCKTLVTFIILAAFPAKYALTAFAVGQLAYGQATLYTFATAYRGDLHYGFKEVTVNLHGNTTNVLFDPELLRLSGAMTLQSVVKHFLTEGDKFLVSRLSPLADQGGYAIASNYGCPTPGSLVARILFQPIEETVRVFFSKTLPSITDLAPFTTPTDAQTAALQLSSHILHTLLLLFTHLLLLLATFAPPFLPIATNTFLPPRYRTTSAPTILGAYIYYIPTMAYNGVLEAFLAAACTPADLRAQSRMMAGATLAFVGAAVWFARGLRLGDAGLVWANIANLGARALYAWAFVRRYYAARGLAGAVDWRGAVPPGQVLVVFAGAAVVARVSARAGAPRPKTLWAQKRHIVTGGVLAVGCLAACFVFEKDQFAQVLSVLRKR